MKPTLKIKLDLFRFVLAKVKHRDESTNRRFYNLINFEWDGCPFEIYLQRWCRGIKRGQVNFVKVRRWPRTAFSAPLTKREVISLLEAIKTS